MNALRCYGWSVIQAALRNMADVDNTLEVVHEELDRAAEDREQEAVTRAERNAEQLAANQHKEAAAAAAALTANQTKVARATKRAAEHRDEVNVVTLATRSRTEDARAANATEDGLVAATPLVSHV